jgi:hypothetical protein
MERMAQFSLGQGRPNGHIVAGSSKERGDPKSGTAGSRGESVIALGPLPPEVRITDCDVRTLASLQIERLLHPGFGSQELYEPQIIESTNSLRFPSSVFPIVAAMPRRREDSTMIGPNGRIARVPYVHQSTRGLASC